jgi:multimeric flavodoxin WrbA
MKIIGIVGSPRVGGNTQQLVQQILAGAGENGAETKLFNVTTMKISGCSGCNACRKDGQCVQQDDMQSLYPEIAAADVVVVGTPVYMGQMTAQLKAFFDRLLPFMNPDFTSRLQGKKQMVLAVTQGNADAKAYVSYFQQTMNVFQSLGFTPKETVVSPRLYNLTDFAQNSVEMARAKDLGAQLAQETSAS